MKRHLTLTSLAMLIASASALASPQLDPSITHQPKDNVINVYGPGGLIPLCVMLQKLSPRKVV